MEQGHARPDQQDCGDRLTRIAGQAPGIARMIGEEDRYCIDILTQLRAVRAALRRVEDEVLNDHVEHCVEGAIASGDAGYCACLASQSRRNPIAFCWRTRGVVGTEE